MLLDKNTTILYKKNQLNLNSTQILHVNTFIQFLSFGTSSNKMGLNRKKNVKRIYRYCCKRFNEQTNERTNRRLSRDCETINFLFNLVFHPSNVKCLVLLLRVIGKSIWSRFIVRMGKLPRSLRLGMFE